VSLKAGGAGLNLTAADTVIHCDPWWNPAVEEQATDRAHRMGQARAVTVVRLVASGTIEEKIGTLKAKKKELAAAVIANADGDGGGEGDGAASAEALRGLTEADVDALLGGLRSELDDAGLAASDTEEHGEPEGEVVVPRRFVPARDVDELRAILRRIEGSGKPRKDLPRKIGLPVARFSLLLIGHAVPIPTRAAEKIRALRIALDPPA
jgi:hypothetical protein